MKKHMKIQLKSVIIYNIVNPEGMPMVVDCSIWHDTKMVKRNLLIKESCCERERKTMYFKAGC